jgi:peptidoglycan/LPS O-acetylase OafA/YrhL
LSAERFYRPELDGLRFLAFALVFLHHSVSNASEPALARIGGPWFADAFAATIRAGAYGVDLFFVLSSFLITELLLRELDKTGRLDVRSFLIRRALRIWPLYFTFLAVVGWILPHAIGFPQPLDGATAAAFVFLLGNWACAVGGYPASPAAPLWSVSIEEQFYLAWPAVVRFGGTRVLPWIAAAMLGIGSASRLLFLALGLPHPWTWCATPTRLDPIAIGILLCLGLRRGKVAAPSGVGRLALALVGAAALWWAGFLMDPGQPPSALLALAGYPAVAIGAGLLLLAALGSRGFLAAPAIVWLGRISYGLYVFHELAIRTSRIGLEALGLSVRFTPLPALALTIATAAVSYRLLESPFLRLKERFAHVLSRAA